MGRFHIFPNGREICKYNGGWERCPDLSLMVRNQIIIGRKGRNWWFLPYMY